MNNRITVPKLPAPIRDAPSMAALRRLLADALGTAQRASEVLALAAPGDMPLPSTGPDVLAFAHARLARVLAPELGPRAVLMLLTSLDAELSLPLHEREAMGGDDEAAPTPRVSSRAAPRHTLEPGSSRSVPPTSNVHRKSVYPRIRPSVILVDEDRYRRATLAQRLVSSGCDVVTVDNVPDFAAALAGRQTFHAALIDVAHDLLPMVVRSLAGAGSRVHLVALAHSEPSARGILTAAKATNYCLHLLDEPPDSLVRLLCDLVGPG